MMPAFKYSLIAASAALQLQAEWSEILSSPSGWKGWEISR